MKKKLVKLQQGNVIPEKEKPLVTAIPSRWDLMIPNPIMPRILIGSQLTKIGSHPFPDKMQPKQAVLPVIENPVVSSLPIPAKKTFSQAFAEARKAALAGGPKTFEWTNPKTGKLGVYGADLAGETSQSTPKIESKKEVKKETSSKKSEQTYSEGQLKEVEIIAKRPSLNKNPETPGNIKAEQLGYVSGNPFINSKFLVNENGKHKVVYFDHLLKNQIPFWSFNNRGYYNQGNIHITKI